MTMHNNRFHQVAASGAVFSGAALAALFAVAGPGAGTAHAHGYSTPSGDAVGRPGLDNPAPAVRFTQAVGDHVFNQSTPFKQALDNSALGQNYHAAFGTPNYEVPTHGSNGTNKGVLNTPGALQEKYNAAQDAGRGLPDEEDLPGTTIRLVSGAPAPTPHETSADQSDTPHAAASATVKCTVLAAQTTLRAQGSC